MDTQHIKNIYSVNVNKENNDLYGSYSTSTPCAQQPQAQRPQHFLPPYAMPVPMTNNMSQQLMYNTQSQPMYNIMYGPQSMYRNQNTSFPQPIDTVSWVPDTFIPNSDITSKNKYIKYDNKSKENNVTNCCPTRMENIPCSTLPDVYKTVNKNFYYNKNGIMDSQWFYSTNYDSQKYKELPSCSQVTPYSGAISNNDECCTSRDASKNIKSVKYCSIQKYSESDSKLYMYQNKYDNQEMFSNQYTKIPKDYPSCSQLTSTCNLYSGSSSCLEIDKKILSDTCDVTNSCNIIPSNTNQGYYTHAECPGTVLEHFDVEKIDDKNTEESNEEGGGESDIVVEDSDEEITDESEDIDKEEIKSCLVCNIANADNQFYVITSTTLFTTYSKTLVSNKLFNILGSLKNHSNNLCTACMNLINTLDNLELQMNNIKQDIAEKYKSTLETLKLYIVDTKISETHIENNKLRAKIVKKYQNIKFKSKDVCGIHSFKCCICEKIFSLKKFYKYHMSKHKIKTKYLCEHCGCNFVKHSNLKIHLRKHTQYLKTRCSLCNKNFSHISSLKKHNCSTIEIKNFICHICGKKFKTKTNLKDHECFCSGEKPFHCYECNKQFTTRTKLKNHILLKHDQKFTETCTNCGKGFIKPSDYKAHLLTHSSEKKFKCQICNKTYKTLSNLNYHLKSHNDKLPFNCNICQKGFLRKEHLESHLNMHNGLKPFNCPICDKKFSSQKNLDAHVRVHKGTNKKQTCTICGKKISHGLEDHMRSHSNIKNLECNFCENKFLTKGALAKHKKRKHDNFELDVL